MRILVEDIPRPGQTVRIHGPESADGEVVASALEAVVSRLEGTLKIERVERGMKVTVKAHVRATRPCDRCGAPVELVLDVDEQLAYEPPPDHKGHKEIELSAEELDAGFLRDGGLDTADALSEAFALASPLRVTCPDDLCLLPVSSSDDHAADDVVGHPAFQALKKLL